MSSLREQAKKCKPAVVKVISIMSKVGETYRASFGSGFVVNENGFILTNNHVVSNPDPQANFVQFFDGTRKKVLKMVHQDSLHDFALLQIENGEYDILELGSYQDTEEGDEIFFCGYPLHSNFHVIQKGMVSSKFSERDIDKFQMDASVNVGNSGGPMLSMDEEVVGIITEKAGGIDKKMKDTSDFVLSAPTIFTTNWGLPGGKTVSLDPTKELAKVISIIHDYTNVGIGYAYSIDYAVEIMKRLRMI